MRWGRTIATVPTQTSGTAMSRACWRPRPPQAPACCSGALRCVCGGVTIERVGCRRAWVGRSLRCARLLSARVYRLPHAALGACTPTPPPHTGTTGPPTVPAPGRTVTAAPTRWHALCTPRCTAAARWRRGRSVSGAGRARGGAGGGAVAQGQGRRAGKRSWLPTPAFTTADIMTRWIRGAGFDYPRPGPIDD